MSTTDALMGSGRSAFGYALQWALTRLGVYALAAGGSMAVFMAWAVFYTYVWPGKPHVPASEPPSINREAIPEPPLPPGPPPSEQRGAEVPVAAGPDSGGAAASRAGPSPRAQVAAAPRPNTGAPARQGEAASVPAPVAAAAPPQELVSLLGAGIADKDGRLIGVVSRATRSQENKTYIIVDLIYLYRKDGSLAIPVDAVRWVGDDSLGLRRGAVPYSIDQIRDAISKIDVSARPSELGFQLALGPIFYWPYLAPDWPAVASEPP
jgi:hypothetical protein